MHRREILRLLAGAAVLPAFVGLSPDELFALGRRTHERARRDERRPRRNGSPFDPHQMATVTAVAQRILPNGDTPGAKEVGVPEFLALLVGESLREAPRGMFMDGLADLDTRSRSANGKDFADAGDAEQDALLTALEAEMAGMRAAKQPTATHFYPQLKGLVLFGYYTSKPILGDVMHYEIIPGNYQGCAPLRTSSGER